MEALWFLIPLAALFSFAVVGILVWAVRSGQFEDLEGPAHRILFEEATDPSRPLAGASAPTRWGGNGAPSIGDDDSRFAAEVRAQVRRRR